jgi:hypothetical protein
MLPSIMAPVLPPKPLVHPVEERLETLVEKDVLIPLTRTNCDGSAYRARTILSNSSSFWT